jgi:FMN phosphatase YigB (HAD superfamily)
LCTSTIWLEIEGVFRDRDSEWQQEFLRHLSLNDRFDFTYCFGIYTLYLM